MTSRYDVELNGAKLSEIDERILILDVNYAGPDHEWQNFATGGRDGSTRYGRYKGKSSVSISFAVRAYDIAERQAVCQSICAWARDGGVLKINDRPDQFLRCECDQRPYIASAMKWTDPLTVVFAAYNIPYWQNESADSILLSGTSANGTLSIGGNAPETVVSAIVTAQATLKRIVLTAGDTSMTISGINVALGRSLILSYTDEGIQRITYNGQSMLAYRTGADDLIAKCGQANSVSFQADAQCRVEFSARGLWE